MHSIQRELDQLRRQVEGLARIGDQSSLVEFRIARLVSAGGASPSPSPCLTAVWSLRFGDATFAQAAGLQPLHFCTRGTDLYFAAAASGLSLAEGHIVGVAESNARWWILCTYGACASDVCPCPCPSPSP